MTSSGTTDTPGATSAAAAVEPEAEALGRRFPPDFRWGTATASYQIEGGVNDGGRGQSIWDTFSHTPGRVATGETGDVACDHYHRWRDDVDLMASLGLRAYRFSVAWPRVQPTGAGAANEEGLDFYDRLIDGLLERGIEPWLTVYHWDLPQALEDRGGWPEREVVDRFGEYAGLLAQRFGDRVRHWITLNEPQVAAAHGYGTGEHAPGRRDWNAAFRATHHLHLAHRTAMAAIRAAAPSARVGITLNLWPIQPASDAAADVAAAGRRDAVFNRLYLDPVFGRGYPSELLKERAPMFEGVDPSALDGPAPPLDFLGVNYYSRELVRDAPGSEPVDTAGVEPRLPVTAMGWEVYPPGLREVLDRVAQDYAPSAIAITENGAAYPDTVAPDGSIHDLERRAYIAAHLNVAAEALEAGIPLMGYFAWSLLDNFEWAHGTSKRFGIVRTDYATQRRTVKASGQWYASLIEAWSRQPPSG